MPLYDYRCEHCGWEDEQVVPMTAVEASITCPHCGKRADRVYSAPAIHFKGSGFYNTDYKRKKEHGAKEDKPPQEVKSDADKTGHPDKPAPGLDKPATRQAAS